MIIKKLSRNPKPINGTALTSITKGKSTQKDGKSTFHKLFIYMKKVSFVFGVCYILCNVFTYFYINHLWMDEEHRQLEKVQNDIITLIIDFRIRHPIII